MAIEYRLTGKVIGVFLGLDPNTLITTLQKQVQATFSGFEGDHHAGITRASDGRTPHYPRGTEIRNGRQVSIVAVEELALISARMGLPEIQAEWLGANLLIQGIPNLTLLPPNSRFFFAGGTTLAITAENLPCRSAGKAIQESAGVDGIQELFPKAGMHLRGLVAYVEKPGVIQNGEDVRVETPLQVIYSPEPGLCDGLEG